MTKPRRYGGKSHPATPTQEQTRPISTETSNLDKKKAVSDVSCKDEPWKNKSCKLMTKPRRYGGKSHPATPTQEQTRPISTETSNLYVKKAVFDISCKDEPWNNKSCKLMTKPRRYGGKSHPATPTQEQTRPISTETSNLYKKYAVFDVSCKDEPWKNKSCKVMTKPRRYGGKSHPATPTQEQTRPISTETSNLYVKKAVFDISCKDEPWKNNSFKLMTKPRRYGGKSHPATPTQEQTRPISTETSNLYKKYTVFDISCVNGHCRNKTFQIDDQTAQVWWKISSRDANSGANETNIDGN